MLKIFLFMSIFLFSSVSANWKDTYAEALFLADAKDFLEANKKFTQCLAEIDEDSSYVYVDRAKTFELLGNYQKAVEDINTAIDSCRLDQNQLCRALTIRITCNVHLMNHDQILLDMTSLKRNSPIQPEIEETDNYIIVRNPLPEPCFKKMMTTYFIERGDCQSENDILMMNGNWVIQRKKKACKECGCNNRDVSPMQYQNCCVNCDILTVMGVTFCAKIFQGEACRQSCYKTVEMIRDNLCYKCCAMGFYETCWKPFEDILGKMDTTKCDPAFD